MGHSGGRRKLSQEEHFTVMAFIDRSEVAELFAAAVAQGMHAPFGLDCDYWGRQYQEKLLDLLDGAA